MKLTPSRLFLAATMVVVALALISDPSAPISEDLASAQESQGPVKVVCQMVSVEERGSGWALLLADASGSTAQAFLSRDVSSQPPLQGDVVEIVLEPSDRPGFFFVRGFSALEAHRPPVPEAAKSV